ncbi:MAG: 4'-phosphopantetheinyl transferase family protein [Culicoidibacterales bacterium]
MKIFMEDLRAKSATEIDGFYNKLTPSEKERIQRYHKRSDQIQALYSKKMLTDFLERHNLDKASVEVSKSGKKFLKKGEIHFSISHSGNFVVFVEHEDEVGVDVEKIALYDKKIGELCFSRLENRLLDNSLISERDCLFTKIWTRKESYVKMTGSGLSSVEMLKSIETRLYEDKVYSQCDRIVA